MDNIARHERSSLVLSVTSYAMRATTICSKLRFQTIRNKTHVNFKRSTTTLNTTVISPKLSQFCQQEAVVTVGTIIVVTKQEKTPNSDTHKHIKTTINHQHRHLSSTTAAPWSYATTCNNGGTARLRRTSTHSHSLQQSNISSLIISCKDEAATESLK